GDMLRLLAPIVAPGPVVGVDLSETMIDEARHRALAVPSNVTFQVADVHTLPFDDASFDRVVSTFGHMFAPDHARTAAEMKRVLRPDGVIAVACWTPEGSIGRMFRTIVTLVPPPPGGQPPLLWGTEDHVRELWGEAEFERHAIEWQDESVESYARFMLDSFGPLLNARELLAEREHELDEAFTDYLRAENENDDGTLRFSGEYLLSVVRP
ncbi:MAG TPA: class I SAM-dependent methyltransferase, partial [Thermoleophilaceae bacterium]|nr:class I SAM-dependent methyltransferase [Thermoleophilaceae bacterium]